MQVAQETRRAVLLNDTSFVAHHGSRQVVATIRSSLARRGIKIVASTPAGAHWERNQAFIDGLTTADLVVINGEGTLHDGAPAGERLLRIAQHPLRSKRPIALINALWQDNPKAWHTLLKKVDLIVVRDGRSKRELARDGIGADLCPDLSFYHDWGNHRRDRNDGDRIVFGDSVYRDVSKALFTTYQNHRGPRAYLPIRARQRHELHRTLTMTEHVDNLRHHLRAWMQSLRDCNQLMARDAKEYVAHLARGSMHVTGRYHAVCLSIAIGMPFVAVASNSNKIEALIDDIGLDARRIAKSVDDALDSCVGAFSNDEKASVEQWLALARKRADEVFDSVAALARLPHH